MAELLNTCAICGAKYTGYGNSTWGFWPDEKEDEGERLRCCDKCNMKFVVPARMRRI